MEDSLPGSHNIDVPNIKRTELTLITIDEEGFLSLMNEKGECRNDIKLPDETDDDIEISKKLKVLLKREKNVLLLFWLLWVLKKSSNAKNCNQF